MCAPDILIPIKSTNKLVYLAHLGTLKLVNFFKRDTNGRLIDHLHFELTDLKLNRARVAEDIESNEIEGEIEVIKPINFNLGKITNIYFWIIKELQKLDFASFKVVVYLFSSYMQ